MDIELNNSSQLYIIVHSEISLDVGGCRIRSEDVSRRPPTYNYPNFYDKHYINFIASVTKQVSHKNFPIAYTDGSRMPGGVVAAFVVYLQNEEIFSKRIRLCN